MTCIVGLIEKDKIYLGADSAGVGGWSLTVRKDPKVFKNGKFVFGFTSSFRMGQLLNFKFKPPKQKKDQSDYEFMVTTFVDAVKDSLESWMKTISGQDKGGVFIVGYKKKLYVIHDDFQVGISHEPYCAVGAGGDIALGSLYTTNQSDMSPRERLTMALNAAARFNAAVCEPFVFVDAK